MKRYKAIFSGFHTIYRLSTSSANVKNFASGVCKVYKNVLEADRVVMVCKCAESHPFIKVCLEERLEAKRGGISILTPREREILMQEKEIILDRRLVHIFVFADTLGGIYIKRKPDKDIFSDLEKKCFFALSEVVSTGLKIFELYREEDKTLINYIKSLTKLLGRHDPTSSLHAKGVLRLIKALGKEMKLTEAQLRSIQYASLLHDAGEIHLPSEIFTKQKRLTSEEYKIIMKHPRKGVELIKNLQFLKPAIPIILHHHEHFDGRGYPAHLRKDQIPIGSRILAVLDAFGAMYFGRPYRKKKDLGGIVRELKKQMGKQFDPKVIEAFLRVLKKKNVKKYLRRIT